MKAINILAFVIPVLLISCGPSAEEIARQQKHRDDSVAVATANRIEHKNKLTNQLKEFKQQLIKYKADLEAANDKMVQIKEFHFLRTGDEREQQIRQQSEYISHLEENIGIITQNIDAAESNLANL